MAEQQEHLLSPRLYLVVLMATMGLLFVTVFMAFVDIDGWSRAHGLGSQWNTAIALSIAFIKGLLIVLFFMHVRYGSRLTWVAAAAGFVWLGIMLSLTMSDYLTRNHPAGVNAKGEPKYIVSPTPSMSAAPLAGTARTSHQ